MIEINIFASVFTIVMALILVSDLYKGVVMVFSHQAPLLFIAQISFFLLKLLPRSVREDRYNRAMNIYIKRKRLYGFLALIEGVFGVLLLVVVVTNNF
jgi:hypothetical protein